jgi:hypothetical protein
MSTAIRFVLSTCGIALVVVATATASLLVIALI